LSQPLSPLSAFFVAETLPFAEIAGAISALELKGACLDPWQMGSDISRWA